MARILVHVTVAFALLGTGWAVARAQTPKPDFELVVEAPAGPATVKCVRGCTLMWVERGIPANGRPQPSFEFSCSGGGVQRCSSARVGGWIVP